MNQLPCPVFTRYIHKNGHRYEVEVGAVRGWGECKFYRTEADAADAAAHQTLYQLLTEGCDELAVSTAAAAAPAEESFQMKQQPSAPPKPRVVPARNDIASMEVKMDPGFDVDTRDPKYFDRQDSGRRLSRGERKRRRGVVSNLVPLQNARIPTVDCSEPEPESKWKINRHDLLKELRPMGTWVEKVESMFSSITISQSGVFF